MAKPDNQFQEEARKAAARIDRQRELGEQLTFLPDETPQAAGVPEAKGSRAGKPNKATSQLRQWLAEKGLRLPEDVLAQMAGLASSDSAMVQAMQEAEAVLSWAYDVDELPKKTSKVPSPAKRLEIFMQLYTIKLRAADALMPYGAPKASPDVAVQQNTTIVMPGAPAPARAGDQARDVTPAASRRMAPPPLPHEMQENQGLGDGENGASDKERRTE